MARFQAPPSTVPPKDIKEKPVVSTGQVVAGVVVVAVLVLGSRGRITTTRAEGIARFLVKGIVGLGGIHQLTEISSHGPNPNDTRTLNAARQPTLDETLALLKDRVSDSGRYIKFRFKSSGQEIQIPIEDLQILVDAGFITQKQADAARKVGGVRMTKLWAADP